MSQNELHPSVKDFKAFVNKHPRVKNQLRRNHKLIQTYYEKWLILGEKDPFWDSLPSLKNEEPENKMDWFKQIGIMMEDIDWQEVSRHIDELNGAIGQFQQIITEAKQTKAEKRHEIEYPYY